jgi:serpin B
MTYNGANGETQTAMEKTLKVYGLTPEDINKSYSDLVAALKSLDPKVLLEIANAIFYRQNFQVENDFVSINKNYYDARVDAFDFSSPKALETINSWVADKTRDKIKTILKEIKPDNVMFLLNAIYFKGIWQTKFDKDNTKNIPFHTENGTVNVPTMQKTDALRYTTNELFSAVQLPYGAGNYNMYLFLPEPDYSVQDIISGLDKNNWTNWMDSFGEPVNIDLQIPRLKYMYEIKLNDVLSKMGMGIAFGGGADFTGINQSGGLYIDYVKHKTFIEVNEEGTEAAAVTIVAISKLSAGPPQNIPFYVNRPFFYVITEKDTGAILFMGTVKNPELD